MGTLVSLGEPGGYGKLIGWAMTGLVNDMVRGKMIAVLKMSSEPQNEDEARGMLVRSMMEDHPGCSILSTQVMAIRVDIDE